ncbi:MAG: hypothetical protein R3Y45_08735 [Bacillota bacterium]
MKMWITQAVFHNRLPGNADIQSSTSINRLNNGENQRAGHATNKSVVDNFTAVDKIGGKSTANADNQRREDGTKAVLKEEISALKADLSTMENRDKQRGNSTFSEKNEQVGHEEADPLWKTEKLSTITVDNIWEQAKNNPFKAGMAVKKQVARGLDSENERMLFSMMVKLDFKCEKDVCEIRVMANLAGILENNVEKIEKYACGFKIKIIAIETFTASTQVEVDKIKKYFGEDYVKMVTSLTK